MNARRLQTEQKLAEIAAWLGEGKTPKDIVELTGWTRSRVYHYIACIHDPEILTKRRQHDKALRVARRANIPEQIYDWDDPVWQATPSEEDCRSLFNSLLLQEIKIFNGKNGHRSDAAYFLISSPDFLFICDLLGLEGQFLREYFRKNAHSRILKEGNAA